MNKNEFLNLLRIKLDVLSQVEIDELIAEYSEHIDNKLHEGKSEEQAVGDFGDIGELTRNILLAYKLNENFTSKPKINNFLHMGENTGRKLIHSFEQFYAKISLSEVFKFLILVILSFGLVAILKFPFMLFKSISLWFMEIIFGYKFVGLVEGIWSFIVNAVYYLSSILLIISVVHFGQQRYTQITHQSNKLKKDSIISEDEVIETVYIKNTKIVNEEPIVTQSKKPKQGFKNFIHQMVNLFYLCILWSLRLLILAVLFPMVIAVVFGLFVWGMLVFLVLTKVPVIGFMFTTGMGLVLAASIIFIIFAFTFNLKLKAWRYSRIFSIMIITLILGGFGSIWSINELSQFEWVNSNSQEYTNHEYKMNEFDKIELINAWTNIEIDNSLEDQIMIKLSSEFNTNENPLSQVDQTLIVSMNAYSEVDEMNEFRNRIMQQFNALKEGKLVFQRDNNQNEVIIRVNEKNYKLLQDRLSYN